MTRQQAPLPAGPMQIGGRATYDKSLELTMAAFFVCRTDPATCKPEDWRACINRLADAVRPYGPSHELPAGLVIAPVVIAARALLTLPRDGGLRATLDEANARYRKEILDGAGSRPVDGWPWERQLGERQE